MQKGCVSHISDDNWRWLWWQRRRPYVWCCAYKLDYKCTYFYLRYVSTRPLWLEFIIFMCLPHTGLCIFWQWKRLCSFAIKVSEICRACEGLNFPYLFIRRFAYLFQLSCVRNFLISTITAYFDIDIWTQLEILPGNSRNL